MVNCKLSVTQFLFLVTLLHARRLLLSLGGQKVFDTSLSSGNTVNAYSTQLLSGNTTHNLDNAHNVIGVEMAVLGGNGDDALWGCTSSLFDWLEDAKIHQTSD